MGWLWTKMVIVFLDLHSMYHLFLPHIHTHPLHRLGVQAAFHFSRLPKERYVQLGDINIGVLSAITTHTKTSNREDVCSDKGHANGSAEALAFAVQEVNKGDLLPNNTKLGFVLLNTCFSKKISLASTVFFLPQTACPNETKNDGKCQGTYDVVAVVGSSTSDMTISTTRLLTPAKIPVVSSLSTSDELSNTERFPYFVRVVPPDRFQFKAMAELIKLFGWTYVSMVHESTSYGDNAFTMLSDFLDAFNICLTTVGVFVHGSDEEARSIAEDLVEKHAEVTVVVLIADSDVAEKMITAAQCLSPNKTFVWIGTDAWSRYATSFGDCRPLDSLLLDINYINFSVFKNWYTQLTPDKKTSPWFRKLWERHFHCSLDNSTCNSSGHLPASVVDTHLEYIVDAVFMIANATSRVLRSENCSDLTGSAARACVTGPRLLRELKATQQEGYSGWLELNSQGDRYGYYAVQQMKLDSTGHYWQDTVYVYNGQRNQLTKVTNVTWTHFKTPPTSFCSKPCAPHHARIMGDVPCCWQCKRCEDNEHVVDGGRVCKRCPKFTWPNPNTKYSTCYRLKPSTIRNANVEGAIVITLALLGLNVSVSVILYLYHHRDNPAITIGKDLSFFMLLAITAGYFTIILFFLTPSRNLCRITFLLYSTSIGAMYGALLVRAIDIFHWYVGKSSSKKRSKTRTHFIYAGRIAFLQIVLWTVLMSQSHQWHGLTQPFPERPYVTHTCTLTHYGVIIFGVYSCLLLVVCMLLTFHTPSCAGKEDKIIYPCTVSILIIWLCFVPAYSVAVQEFHRTIFLVIFLFLNCSMVLFVIILPKAKAVWYKHGDVPIVTEPKVSECVQSNTSTSVIRESFTSISDENETPNQVKSLNVWSFSLNWN